MSEHQGAAGRDPSPASSIADLIDGAEKESATAIKAARAYHQSLKRASRDLHGGKGLVAVVERLTQKLGKTGATPSVTPPTLLAERLKSELTRVRKSLLAAVLAELQMKARDAHLPIKHLADAVALGPFRLSMDHATLTASLEYARTLLERSIPLDSQVILDRVQFHSEMLFAEPLDPDALFSEFEAAMRVAWVRKHRELPQEVRVDLPALYREMAVTRSGAAPGRQSKAEYPVARFVVELRTLLQSQRNREASPAIRPETAVIENTKNAKKSIFIPKDLRCGFGEGAYYQAVVRK